MYIKTFKNIFLGPGIGKDLWRKILWYIAWKWSGGNLPWIVHWHFWKDHRMRLRRLQLDTPVCFLWSMLYCRWSIRPCMWTTTGAGIVLSLDEIKSQKWNKYELFWLKLCTILNIRIEFFEVRPNQIVFVFTGFIRNHEVMMYSFYQMTSIKPLCL